MYLEVGWSDYLYEQPAGRISTIDYPDPRVDVGGPGFYVQLADWLAQLLPVNEITGLCEVGAAVGRGAYECDRVFPALEQLYLIEPSRVFCTWMQLLLTAENHPETVPTVRVPGEIFHQQIRCFPEPLRSAATRVTIRCMALESYLESPHQQFPLTVCCNVLDRHPRPQRFVSRLVDLVPPKGYLVIASPYDFSEVHTPAQSEWFLDAARMVQSLAPFELLGRTDLVYEFRYHNRCWMRFVSDIVCLRRV